MAFGSSLPEGRVRYEVITLDQILEHFDRIINEHRDLLKSFNTKDPFLGMLIVMAKAGHFAEE